MAERKQQPPDRNTGRQGGPPAGGQRRGEAGGQGRARSGSAPVRTELPPPPTGPRPTPRLREQYDQEVRDTLRREFSYQNLMQAPTINKVIINIGMGEALRNAQAMDAAVGDLETITGQRPIVTRAKRSIAAFKLREGDPIGCMVTLRGARMFDFLDKLFNVALPRIRDFSGVSPDSFDGRGNYSLGLTEQLVFPEIVYDRVDRVRGMEVSIVTTARTDDEGRRLLQLMGMPFRTEAAQRAEDTSGSRPRRRASAGTGA